MKISRKRRRALSLAIAVLLSGGYFAWNINSACAEEVTGNHFILPQDIAEAERDGNIIAAGYRYFEAIGNPEAKIYVRNNSLGVEPNSTWDKGIYGGYAFAAAEAYFASVLQVHSLYNTVTVNNAAGAGIYGGYAYGGLYLYSYSDDGELRVHADHNTVRLNQSTAAGDIYGGKANVEGWGYYNIYEESCADANDVEVVGGLVKGKVYGGYAGGNANDEYVKAASHADGNAVYLQSVAAADDVYGGYAELTGRASHFYENKECHADGNTVTVNGGSIAGNIYGGYADSGDARDNTVKLHGVAAKQATVYGGYADGGSSTGNTLAVYGGGTTIKGIGAGTVQNLYFYLDDSVKSNDTALLTINSAADITGIQVGVGVNGSARALRKGDTVSLLQTVGGELTSDENNLVNHTEGMQGVSLKYKLQLARQGTDTLTAQVTEAPAVNERTKSLLETHAAMTEGLNQGADLLAGAGFSAAEQAVKLQAAENISGSREVSPAQADADNGLLVNTSPEAANGFVPWAVMEQSNLRAHSGSYVDTHGSSLGVGFARSQNLRQGTLLHGPFVSYGRGSYDSYLDDGTHGSGNINYFGAGYLAKYTAGDNFYIEGSLQGGRTWSDYAGSIEAGTYTDYDNSGTFYAAQLGIGRKLTLSKTAGLDTYFRYLWSHQKSSSSRLNSGELYDFDSVNSHRLRLGTRWTQKNGEQDTLYAGLAWEYELDGRVCAGYEGYSTPSPSMKGGSIMAELGYRWQPRHGNVSYDLKLSGWQGKREGITAAAQVSWAF